MSPSLTIFDVLRLQWHVTLPMLLGGSVAPNPRFWPYLVRHQANRGTIQFLSEVRRKYGPRAWSWFPCRSTLLVLDRAGIEEVLTSKDTFADPFVKKKVLSTFTPHGVIISRKKPWEARRQLNNHALAFDQPQHPDGGTFVRLIDQEVARMLDRRPDVLIWDDFSTLAARISQQVIFGEYRDDLAMHLARLVSASNWGIRRGSDFAAFFAQIDERLDRRALPGTKHGSLVCRAATWLADHPDVTDAKASSQIAFWLFVMKDAIELHTVRTLALISSAPEDVRQHVYDELTRMGQPTPAGIAALPYLEACIKEELRLWTSAPILLRVALKRTELPGGDWVEKNQQILLHTGLYHRDPEVFGATAERFSPGTRLAHRRCCPMMNVDPPLYVFSGHQQACAGGFLVILLLKTVLASLLTRRNFALLDQSVAMDPVPAAINHFGMRFWRR